MDFVLSVLGAFFGSLIAAYASDEIREFHCG